MFGVSWGDTPVSNLLCILRLEHILLVPSTRAEKSKLSSPVLGLSVPNDGHTRPP